MTWQNHWPPVTISTRANNSPDHRLPTRHSICQRRVQLELRNRHQEYILRWSIGCQFSGQYIDWSNQQLTTNFIFPTGGTASYLINAGKTRAKRVEARLNAAVNEYLTAGASLAIKNEKFRILNDPEATELFGNPSLKGKHTPNAPKYQSTVFGKTTYPLNDQANSFL